MAKVLVVEDEPEIAEVIEELLLSQQHNVEIVTNGHDAIGILLVSSFDLIIMDWGLPGKPGIDVLNEFRKSGGQTPVLLLTARGTVDDKEFGLLTGADDYLTKPFEVRELRARIIAILRRGGAAFVGDHIEYDSLKMNFSTRRVFLASTEIELKPREFSLLELLLKNQDQVFTLDALISRVWESDQDVSYDAVRQCVTRIRKKIDTEGQSSIITTVAGIGYKVSRK